jgi:hypothetical protein
MKITDLSNEALAKIKAARWDRIIEKHEGPFDWASEFEYSTPEFMDIDGRAVLLPVAQLQHANITILRTIWSADGRSLTLFLKDTTRYDDTFSSGFLAVCDRIPGEAFFLAIVYHEWFIIGPASEESCEP